MSFRRFSILVAAIALPGGALAQEFGHDLCWSMASEDISSLWCGSMLTQTQQQLESNPKKWLLGRVRIACDSVEMTNGLWYTYDRDVFESGGYKGKSPRPVERHPANAMLAQMVRPTQTMVCIDWGLAGFQKTAEKEIMTSLIPSFFDFSMYGVQLSTLLVRVE